MIRVLELEPRDCPAPVYVETDVVLVPGRALLPNEAQFIRDRTEEDLITHSAPGRLKVMILDETAVAPLVRRAKKSDKIQAFVVRYNAGVHVWNWLGESDGNEAMVYVGGHNGMPPGQRLDELAATTEHELGHEFGLDHSDNPHDAMSLGFTEDAEFLQALAVWLVLHRPRG